MQIQISIRALFSQSENAKTMGDLIFSKDSKELPDGYLERNLFAIAKSLLHDNPGEITELAFYRNDPTISKKVLETKIQDAPKNFQGQWPNSVGSVS